MEIRIGITQVARELELEMEDNTDAAKLATQIEKSLNAGEGMLWLSDRKGRKVGVPSAKVAYVEIGSNADSYRVGFGKS